MAGIEELLVSIVSKFDDAGFKKLDHSTASASRATSILSNNLRNLFVGVIGTIGVSEIVQATVKMDSLRTSMNALAGSDVGGAEQIEFLRKETDRLGQSFLTTANAYKNLFSAGKGAGMSDKNIQSIFSGVLEAGTVLGSSEQQLQGALTALEQMISKGKVSTQELRLQLGNALPGAMQIAARAMGVTNKEFQKMLESGLDSQKFVMAFANQLHTEFSGKAADASHTLRAELARLQNAIFNLEIGFLDGEAGKEFAKVIHQAVEVLNSPEIKQGIDVISKFLLFALQHVKEIALILSIVMGNKMIGSLAKGLMGAGAGLAKGLMGAGAGLANGFRFVKTLAVFTRNLTFLPRLLAILRLVWVALSPIAKIQMIITLIIAIITAIGGFKKLLDKNNEKTKPKWEKVPGKDNEYRDTNPMSPTFGQQGRGYTQKELDSIKNLNLSDEFLKSLLTTEGKPYRLQDSGNVARSYRENKILNEISRKDPLSDYKPNLYEKMNNPKYREITKNQTRTQTNTMTINKIEINTKSDDTDGIVNGIRSEFTKILDSFGKGSGYLSTPRIQF